MGVEFGWEKIELNQGVKGLCEMEHIVGCRKAPLELFLLSFIRSHQRPMTRTDQPTWSPLCVLRTEYVDGILLSSYAK